MKKAIRDAIADEAIKIVFQDFLDDVISEDELMARLWQMHHPVVGKKPKDCNPEELKKAALWHIERADEIKRDILQRAGMTSQQ